MSSTVNTLQQQQLTAIALAVLTTHKNRNNNIVMFNDDNTQKTPNKIVQQLQITLGTGCEQELSTVFSKNSRNNNNNSITSAHNELSTLHHAPATSIKIYKKL